MHQPATGLNVNLTNVGTSKLWIQKIIKHFMFGSCCIMLLKRYQMISISPKHLEPSQMNNANQSIPIPKNPELDGVIVGIPQAESQIIWSFQSKAWYNKLIFLHDGMIFLEHQQKTGEIPQTATKLSPPFSL